MKVRWVIVVLALVGLSVGCGGGSTPSDGGNGSAQLPLPAGLELVSITSGLSQPCVPPYPGFAVLTVVVRNTTTVEIEMCFEALWIFRPAGTSVQRLMLAVEVCVTIEASAERVVCLPVYCIDSQLAPPELGTTYEFAGTNSAPCMQTIADYWRGKRPTACGTLWLQLAIWDCADTGSVGPVIWNTMETYGQMTPLQCAQAADDLAVFLDEIPDETWAAYEALLENWIEDLFGL